VLTLTDLEDLPRPGGGSLDPRPGFFGDTRVRSLGWPESVVEQFLFDHGANPAFVGQYGHLALDHLSWTLETLPAAEFARVTSFQDWLESYETNFRYWIAQRPRAQQASWADAGTWIEPPLLIDASLLTPPEPGLHVLEGHTRVGILRGRLKAGVADPDQRHPVYVCRHG
jgi:hypothetical protein